jgi:eukaryotic-like serine/threonine-protein kinase
LAGRHPIDAENLGQVFQIILTRGLQPIEEAMPELPANVAQLVSRLLNRDRAERAQDLSEAAAVLGAYATVEAQPFEAPYSLAAQPRQPDAVTLFDTVSHTPAPPKAARDPISAPDASDGKAFASRSYGKYCLISHLACGGMAQVYLAVATQGDLGFRKLVVIKEMHRHLVDDPEYVSMFLDEARLAARLQHQNIVQTYDVGRHEESYFMALEYLQGQSLGQIMNRVRKAGLRIPPGVALRIASDVLRGLEYAHEHVDFDGTPLNIVHRDISPGNIFVGFNGVTKVVDFGIAKAATQSNATRPGVFKGKLSYAPPEQFEDRGAVAQSDLWSLGLVLWEALTLQHAFAGDSDAELIQQILQARLPLLAQVLGPVYPERQLAELDLLISKAVQPRLEERYASAKQMRAAVESLLERIGRDGEKSDVLEFVHNLYGEEITRQRKLVAAAVARSPVASEMRQITPFRGLQPSVPEMSDANSTSLSNLNAEIQVPAMPARTWYGVALIVLASIAAGATLAMAWPRTASSPEVEPAAAAPAIETATPTVTAPAPAPPTAAPLPTAAVQPAPSASVTPSLSTSVERALRETRTRRSARETPPEGAPSAQPSSAVSAPTPASVAPSRAPLWHKDSPTLPPE